MRSARFEVQAAIDGESAEAGHPVLNRAQERRQAEMVREWLARESERSGGDAA
jgi:hypothetical protein